MKTYLNLGCGGHYHPAWTNADLQPAGSGVHAVDLAVPLPFPDAHFEVVYHSHVLEHLPRSAAPSALREQRRVLRPGGVLRVAVPDLEQSARNYLRALEGALQGDPTWGPRYDWTVLELIDQFVRERSGGEMGPYLQAGSGDREFVRSRVGALVLSRSSASERPGLLLRGARLLRGAARHPLRALRGGLVGQSRDLELGRFRRSGEVHQWMYDRYSLARLLLETGFAEPHVVGARESRIPGWEAFHLDTTPDGAVRKPDSLFMEATRPS